MVEKTVSRTKKKRHKKASKLENIAESLIPSEERTALTDEAAEYVESLISPEERLNLISEAAYYRAEQRGFIHGGHEQDWLDAERSVDELLSEAAKKANY